MQNDLGTKLILEKADGMTMGKAPTELRMPYLSVPYAEFALTMPLSLCRFEERRKYICYQLAKRLEAPGIIVKRTQKQRTSLPYYHLFFNNPDFREYVHCLLNEHSRLKEYIKIKNPGAYINSLKSSDNGHRCAWALLILEIWLQQHFH